MCNFFYFRRYQKLRFSILRRQFVATFWHSILTGHSEDYVSVLRTQPVLQCLLVLFQFDFYNITMLASENDYRKR